MSTWRAKYLSFSLRWMLLIVFVTPAAVWVFWWRRPFEKEVVIEVEPARPRDVMVGDDGREYRVRPFYLLRPGPPIKGVSEFSDAMQRKVGYYRRDVRTVRLTGRNELERHGTTRSYNKVGRLIVEESWRNGALHGPYRHWDENGKLRFSGQFTRGERDGEWTDWDEAGKVSKIRSFRSGEPIGTWVEFSNPKSYIVRVYAGGVQRKTVQVNKQWGWMVRRDHDKRGKLQLTRRFEKNEQGGYTETQRTEFRDGVQHGQMIRRHLDGSLLTSGEYRQGKPLGRWVFYDEQGQLLRTCEFADGLLKTVNGKEVTDVTNFCRATDGDQRGARCCLALTEETTIRLSDKPLEELVSYLGDLHYLLFSIDSEVMRDESFEEKLTVDLRGLPLSTALTILLEERGWTCVSRDEHLRITTMKKAMGRSTDNGLSDLAAPPAIARALAEDTTLEFKQVTLSNIVAYLSKLHRIPIRVSPELADVECRGSLNLRNISLRSSLSVMFDDNNLKCEVDGDTLVIKPR
ncbi:MAG: hypothetical protein QGG36_24565 [Pirellulaceae bacterium]|jgi:antitoxin component YwqK of YwqJK toxin-antitoxin module|nr:hypothetical protein [Pirellulaceae bacterium]